MLYFSCATEEADGSTASRVISVEPRRFIIAGWTGRDVAAIEHHIEELAALGVPRPSSVPLYYRAGKNLLSQDVEQEVIGSDSSGEAEHTARPSSSMKAARLSGCDPIIAAKSERGSPSNAARRRKVWLTW